MSTIKQLTDSQMKLMEAKNLIQVKGWGQGDANQYDANGNACNYCIIGAASTAGAPMHFLYDALGGESLVLYNDAPGRTKEEVLQLFDKAITLAG